MVCEAGNLDALTALLAEWTSGCSYAARVENFRIGGGANGDFTLDESSIIDDGAADVLFGQAGLDWFLAGSRVRVIARASGEFVN